MGAPQLPDPKVVHARDAAGRPICGAKTRGGAKHPKCTKSGRHLDPECGRCRIHGGFKSGRPITTGLYSKRLRGRLGELAAQAEHDGDLVDMQAPLPMLKAVVLRLGDLVEEKDTPQFRDRALQLLRDLMHAEEGERGAPLHALEAHLEKGAEETKALEEFRRAASTWSERQEGAWRIALSQRHAWTNKQVSGLALRILETARAFMDADTHRRFASQCVHDLLGPGSQLDLSVHAHPEPAAPALSSGE